MMGHYTLACFVRKFLALTHPEHFVCVCVRVRVHVACACVRACVRVNTILEDMYKNCAPFVLLSSSFCKIDLFTYGYCNYRI